MKVTDVLSPSEIKSFTEGSDLKGFQAVFTTLLIIASAFFLAHSFRSWWAILIALILLGGRHLALAILTHDASHFSLFKSRSLNQVFGWICGSITWVDLSRYRAYHLRHHQFAGTTKDPDLSLVSPYPVSKSSFARKVLRDLLGVSGFKRVYGLLLMDFGFIEFTLSGSITPIDQSRRSLFDVIKTGFQHLWGVLICNLVLYLILTAFLSPWLYLLWIISYLTTFSLILRIRSIAEHACTEMDPDPLKCTRTTYASPLGRLTVAPHRVNYHLEHHLLMNVPYFKLPTLHQLLLSRGAYENAFISKSYPDVIFCIAINSGLIPPIQ